MSLTFSAHATTMRRLSLSQLVSLSSKIAVVEVMKKESRFTSKSRIYTFYQLRPLEVMRGQSAAKSPISLASLGGTVGSISQVAIGAPHFRVGEKCLLFMRPGKHGMRVVGLFQGAFELTADNTEKWVEQFRSRVHLVGEKDERLASRVSLNSMRDWIRDEAEK